MLPEIVNDVQEGFSQTKSFTRIAQSAAPVKTGRRLAFSPGVELIERAMYGHGFGNIM
jgi:hypothetical protein